MSVFIGESFLQPSLLGRLCCFWLKALHVKVKQLCLHLEVSLIYSHKYYPVSTCRA